MFSFTRLLADLKRHGIRHGAQSLVRQAKESGMSGELALLARWPGALRWPWPMMRVGVD